VYGNDTTSAVLGGCGAPTGRSSYYGATKRAGELLSHSYAEAVRPQNRRGFASSRSNGPWGGLTWPTGPSPARILRGRGIPVFGEGKLQRDFTYIDDIVLGACQDRRDTVRRAGDQLRRTASTILGNSPPGVCARSGPAHIERPATGRKAAIDFRDGPPGDVRENQRRHLQGRARFRVCAQSGFYATVSARFVAWFRGLLSALGGRILPRLEAVSLLLAAACRAVIGLRPREALPPSGGSGRGLRFAPAIASNAVSLATQALRGPRHHAEGPRPRC